jgi:sialidase-1
VLLRRSTDGGKSWLSRQHINIPGRFERNPSAVQHNLGKDGEITFNNPVAIVDRKNGAVHLLVCVEYARCFYLRSDDEGQTITKPVEITAAFEPFKKEYPWRVLATGPGHGIQLANGRLVVPVWLSTGDGGHAHRPSAVSVIYSDDHGGAWRPGDIVVRDPDLANPSETAALQLADGRVMLNIRNEGKPQFRVVSFSADGATRWSGWQRDEHLPEPICMASLVRLSEARGGDKNRILFSNPNNPSGRERKNVSVRLSYDEGKSWPVVKPIEPGPSGYSDLAVAPDGMIYCFYERGEVVMKQYTTRSLTMARFNLEWLTDGKDTFTK